MIALPNCSTNLEKLHPTQRYAVEIVSGLRPSCQKEWQACNRHLKDLQRVGSEGFPFIFDESRANRIYDWFERCCRHVRGPFSGELIQLLPFQKFDLGSVFGWVHKETGRRRFKKSFNELLGVCYMLHLVRISISNVEGSIKKL